MYLCVCSSITEEEWKKALNKCNNNWIEASNITGAGLNCGSCRVLLQEESYKNISLLPVLDFNIVA